MPILELSKAKPPLPRAMSNEAVLSQVGWLGQSGTIYALDDDAVTDELGSFRALYVSVGVWKPLGDGRYGIKD